MAYKLPDIPYLKLKFLFSAESSCSLPPVKGSMLRGAFGHALRKTVCVISAQQECRACMLRWQCVYTRLFESFLEGEPPPLMKGLDTAPNPYVLEPYDQKESFEPGELFSFDLLLFGRSCEMHPYVVFAFMRAGDMGFSAKRHRFELQQVLWHNAFPSETGNSGEWHLLYDGATQCLKNVAQPHILKDDVALASPVTLRFLTPTRLKFKDSYTMQFNFRMLVFKMIRRALELAHFHVPDAAPNWEFRELLDATNQVTMSRELQWEDWHRYSNRQQSEMEMGGLVGELTLEGDVKPFSHLIRTSELIHIGKGTTFGLGKMSLK